MAALLRQEEDEGECQKLTSHTETADSWRVGRPLVYRPPGRPRKEMPDGLKLSQMA
jgi:hypothetical protein